jgi:O-antigen/teichoic acid export membrane protein
VAVGSGGKLAFLRSSAALFVGKSAFFGVRILALLAIARVSTQDLFNCISYAMALGELGRLLADCGTETWSLRAIALSDSAVEKAKVVSTALAIKGLAGCAAYLMIVGACAAKFGHLGLVAGLLAGLQVFSTQVAGLTIVYLQAENQLGRLRVLAAPCVLTAAAVFGCLWVTGNSLLALAVLCAGELAAAVLLLGVLQQSSMLTRRLPAGADIRKMLADCATIALQNVFSGLYTKVDTLVVAQLSLASLASYTVANRLFQPFQIALMTLGATVYSRAATVLGKERVSLGPFLQRHLPLICLIAVAAAILLWGVGTTIIELFLPAYRAALMPLRIFSVMLAATALSSTAVGILWAYGEFAVVTRTLVVQTAGALAALLILVPSHGATGAATGLLIVELLTTAIQWRYAMIASRRQPSFVHA